MQSSKPHTEIQVLTAASDIIVNSGTLTGDELKPVDPAGNDRKRNRHQRRKLAAIQRTYRKQH